MADEQAAFTVVQHQKLDKLPNNATAAGSDNLVPDSHLEKNAVNSEKKRKKRKQKPERPGAAEERSAHMAQHSSAPPSAPVASSSSSSTNDSSGGSGNSAEAGSGTTATTTTTSGATRKKNKSSRMRWHEQRGVILGQFHLMNPVQRIDLVHDILLNLYPAERLWIEKVMEDVRQTDAQYFTDFNGHSNDKNTSILKDYLRFGDARAVLIHEGMRKSLIMDIAFLKATSFYNADAFHKLLMDAALDSVCFLPDQLETLMQLMLLYRFCSRHPAFRIQQRFDCERVFHALEHQYYTYCDGGSFLQAAGIHPRSTDAVSTSSSQQKPHQQQPFNRSMPNGVDSSTPLHAGESTATNDAAAAESEKFQQALNRHLEYMYSLDPTTFPPQSLAPHMPNYAAGVAGDASGYDNTGLYNYLTGPAAAAAAAENGGMSLQRVKSASLNDMSMHAEYPTLDQPFAVTSAGPHQQQYQQAAISINNFQVVPQSSTTSVAAPGDFVTSTTAAANSSRSRWTANGPISHPRGGGVIESADVQENVAQHNNSVPLSRSNIADASAAAVADISLPNTSNTTTATTTTVATTSLSSTLTMPFAKLSIVPNSTYHNQQQQQYAMHAQQQQQKHSPMFANSPEAILAAEVGRIFQMQRSPSASYAAPPGYAVDPSSMHQNKQSGVSLESGTQLGLNDDDEHTHFFANSNANVPTQQQLQQQYQNFQHARFLHHHQQNPQQFYRSGVSRIRPLLPHDRHKHQQQQQMFSSHLQRVENDVAFNDNYDHSQHSQLDNVGMPIVVNDNTPYGIFYTTDNAGEFVTISDADMNLAAPHQHFRVSSNDVRVGNSSDVYSGNNKSANNSSQSVVYMNADDPVHSSHFQHHHSQPHPQTFKHSAQQMTNDMNVHQTSYHQQPQQPDASLMPQQHQMLPPGNIVQAHASPHHYYAAQQQQTTAALNDQQQQFLPDPYGNYSPFVTNLLQQTQLPANSLATTITTTPSTASSRQHTMSKAVGNSAQPVVTINPEALQYKVAQQPQQHRFQAPLQQQQAPDRQMYASGNNSSFIPSNSASFAPQQQQTVPAHYPQHSSSSATGRRSQQSQQNYHNNPSHQQRSNVTSPSNNNSIIQLSPENMVELQKHFVLQYANSTQVVTLPSQQQPQQQQSAQYRLPPSLDAHTQYQVSPEVGLSAGMQAADYAAFDNSAAQQTYFRAPNAVPAHRNISVNSTTNMPHSSSSGRLTTLVNNNNSQSFGYAAAPSAAGVLFQQQQQPRFASPQMTLEQQHAHENAIADAAANRSNNDTTSGLMQIRAQPHYTAEIVNSGTSRTTSARSSPAKSSSSSSANGALQISVNSSDAKPPLPATAETLRQNTATVFTTASSPPIMPSGQQQQQFSSGSTNRAAESSLSTNSNIATSPLPNHVFGGEQQYQRNRQSSKNNSGGSLNSNWRAIPQEQPLASPHQRGDYVWGNSTQSAASAAVSPTAQTLNYASAAAGGIAGGVAKQQHPQQKKSSSRNSTDSQQQQLTTAAPLSTISRTQSITSPPLQQPPTAIEVQQRQQNFAANPQSATTHSSPGAKSRQTSAVANAEYATFNGQLNSSGSPPTGNVAVPSPQRRKSTSPPTSTTATASTGQNRMPLTYAAASTLTSSRSSSLLQTSSTAADSTRPIIRNR